MKFWETEPKVNDKGWKQYTEDCIVKILSIDSPVKQGRNTDFQNITVEGPNGCRVSNMSIYWPKGTKDGLQPDQCNVDLPCRIQTIPATDQYAFNGRKYIFKLGAKNPQDSSGSGGGGNRGGGGYKNDPAVQDRIMRSTCLYAACYIYEGVGSQVDVNAIKALAKMFEPYVAGQE